MNNFWDKLSTRERRLAIATAIVLAVSLMLGLGYRATTRLLELNQLVGKLESQLVTCYERDARTVSVERAYKDVATQHSSAWTEAEIHNRLRDEIYRLQLEDPDAGPEQAKKLVEIPSLRQGSLKDTGAGYREYQLTIRIPSTDIASLLIFLCRLQQSQQALRIDSLDITRPPESELVMANIIVTRTVVDRIPEEGEETAPVQEETSASVLTWDGRNVDEWKSDSMDLSIFTEQGDLWTTGGSCLKAEAKGPDASCRMVRELEAGTTYRLTIEALATKPAVIQVVHDADGSPFQGEQEIAGDSKPCRYWISFTVDGEPGAKVKVRVPVVRLKDRDGVVYIDNVGLTRQAE